MEVLVTELPALKAAPGAVGEARRHRERREDTDEIDTR